MSSIKSRVDRRLTSILGTRAVGSAEAGAAEQLGPCRPKADKQQGHNSRRIRPKLRVPSIQGEIGRRLTSSEATMAVESGQNRGYGAAGAVQAEG